MHNHLDDEVVANISYTAHELKSKSIFRHYDEEDLVAELTLYVLQNQGSHDASKSTWRTFASRLVACRARNLIRQCARERNFRRNIGLVALEEPTGFGENDSSAVGADTILDRHPPFSAEIDFQIDLEKYPGDSKEIIRVFELLRDHTQLDAARVLNISIGQLRYRYLDPLRNWLKKRCPEYRLLP